MPALRMAPAVRRAAGIVGAAGALVAAPALGQTMAFHQAFNALKDGNCVTAGEVVNRGIDSNVAEMLYMAGVMLELGLCVDADPKRARTLYAAAAKAGDAGAARRLGEVFARGEGVPRSYRHAAALFEHAARLADDPDRPAVRELGLPPDPGSADDLWTNYLTAVATMAHRYFAYTHEMAKSRSAGAVRLRLCPGRAGVTTQVLTGATATDSAATPEDLVAEVRRGAEEMLKQMPPPTTVALGRPYCGEIEIRFHVPDWGRSTR